MTAYETAVATIRQQQAALAAAMDADLEAIRIRCGLWEKQPNEPQIERRKNRG